MFAMIEKCESTIFQPFAVISHSSALVVSYKKQTKTIMPCIHYINIKK